ncbi:MAG: PHP domain-containing protein [Ruminococcaceae bacterium]|nr:PHP domain-containing protein [Oscillospiraceae bacterium]
MFVDMHLHSNYSDGSDSVSEMVEKLIQANILTFALTDHDSIRGVSELLSYAHGRARTITGVEFSCMDQSARCHILAYGFDVNDPHIHNLVEKGDVLRKKNFENRKNHLEKNHGIFFTEDELAWLFSLPKIGKPHIAKILIARGLAKDTQEVIRNYLDGCKDQDERLQACEVISGILAAGAVPVWAHPLGGEGEDHLGEEEFLSLADTLISYGIKGMECYYSRYTKEEIAFLLNKAEKFHLAVSGGSDYHGSNKTVMLGELQAGECFTVTPDMLSVLNFL